MPRDAGFADVTAAATSLQREVPAMRDLRLAVIDDGLFPCVLAPRDGQLLDWRWLPPEACSWAVQDLPGRVEQGVREQGVRRYTTAAGLARAGVDSTVGEDRAISCLETNAHGLFGSVEIMTGAPIPQTVVDRLTRPSPTGENHPHRYEGES